MVLLRLVLFYQTPYPRVCERIAIFQLQLHGMRGVRAAYGHGGLFDCIRICEEDLWVSSIPSADLLDVTDDELFCSAIKAD